MTLVVGSLFSGIGGFDLAAQRCGMKTAWACEIDPKARAVFRRHFPETKIYADIKEMNGNDTEPVDVLCAGFPCQDLSVAGKRAGLAGERSGLFFEIVQLCQEIRPAPRWLVLENVPGLLSSNKGRDMAAILSSLHAIGYRGGWRVLDAQYFGVPQRRRRVFFVFHLGDWRRAAEVLFERESLCGNPPPRREAWKGVAALTQDGVGMCDAGDNQSQGNLVTLSPGDRGISVDQACAGMAQPVSAPLSTSPHADNEVQESKLVLAYGGNNTSGPIDVATCLNACKTGSGRQDFESETFIAQTTGPICHNGKASGSATQQDAESGMLVTHAPAVAYSTKLHNTRSNQAGKVYEEYVPGLQKDSPPPAVMFDGTINPWDSQTKRIHAGETAPTLSGCDGGGGQRKPFHLVGLMQVRRLMPVECERLQGFPDGWTSEGIMDDGTEAMMADSPRYRMLGNAVAVDNVEWILRRLCKVDAGGEL